MGRDHRRKRSRTLDMQQLCVAMAHNFGRNLSIVLAEGVGAIDHSCMPHRIRPAIFEEFTPVTDPAQVEAPFLAVRA